MKTVDCWWSTIWGLTLFPPLQNNLDDAREFVMYTLPHADGCLLRFFSVPRKFRRSWHGPAQFPREAVENQRARRNSCPSTNLQTFPPPSLATKKNINAGYNFRSNELDVFVMDWTWFKMQKCGLKLRARTLFCRGGPSTALSRSRGWNICRVERLRNRLPASSIPFLGRG